MYTQKIAQSLSALKELRTELEKKFVDSETDKMYFHVKLREVELFIISLENMLLIAE